MVRGISMKTDHHWHFTIGHIVRLTMKAVKLSSSSTADAAATVDGKYIQR